MTTEAESDADPRRPPSPEVVHRLVAAHRDFLAFLEPRVPTRAAAEEILQAAFVRAMERGGGIRDEDSAVAWFYRLLRIALTDFYRRRAAEDRALSALADSLPEVPEPELSEAICRCLGSLLPTLKDEYADALRRVDLEGQSLAAAAEALAVTKNNMTVRLHRAREALRRQVERSCGTCAVHGCLDCTCGQT
jgi:RNA polymerase sigma-70 factor (ECF subfamily)